MTPTNLDKLAQSNPFPRTVPNGRVITDEKCVCGGLRSEHETLITWGHGPGKANADKPLTRDCPRFRWASFVFKND